MRHHERIELTDTPLDSMVKLAEGNPGAVTALMKMMTAAPTIDPDSMWGPIGPLIALDTLGIYGSHIWLLWKDVCHADPVRAETLFRAVQLGFLSGALVTDAARTGRHSFDFDALLAQVRAQLPNFASTGAA